MTRPACRVLLQQAALRGMRVVVPDLIVREVVGVYRRTLEQVAARHEAGVRALSNLGVDIDTVAINAQELSEQYESELRHTLAEARVAVTNHEAQVLAKLVDRATARLRPFDEKGNGFRDALLWESVCAQLMEAPHHRVALVSGDRKAFYGSADALHADLAEDLRALGRDDTDVLLFTDVETLVRERITADPSLHLEVSALIESEWSQIVEELCWATENELLDVDGAVGTARVDQLLNVHSIKVVSVGQMRSDQEGGGGFAYVDLEVVAEAELEVDAITTDDQLVWTTWYTQLWFSATTTYDPMTRELGDMVVSMPSVEIEEVT